MDTQRPHTKYEDMSGRCWIPLQRGVIARASGTLLVFMIPLSTELGKSYIFGLCHATN